jgi:hypothetical protein
MRASLYRRQTDPALANGANTSLGVLSGGNSPVANFPHAILLDMMARAAGPAPGFMGRGASGDLLLKSLAQADADPALPGAGYLSLFAKPNALSGRNEVRLRFANGEEIKLLTVGAGGTFDALDVRADGALCDAVYDADAGTVTSGTDDTAATDATYARVPPPVQMASGRFVGGGGPAVYFPRLCLRTQELRHWKNNVTFQGAGFCGHPTEWTGNSGIAFVSSAANKAAINCTYQSAPSTPGQSQGTVIRDMSVLTSRASGRAGVRAAIGQITLERVKIQAMVGTANTDPTVADGYGLDFAPTLVIQSWATVIDTHISGYDAGVNGSNIVHLVMFGPQCQIDSCTDGIRFGNPYGTVVRLYGVAIYGNKRSNVRIRQAAHFLWDGGYTEYGNDSGSTDPDDPHPDCVWVGDQDPDVTPAGFDATDLITPISVVVSNLYGTGQADPLARFMRLRRAHGLHVLNCTLLAASPGGTLIQNDAIDVSGAYLLGNQIDTTTPTHPPATLISNRSGVVMDDLDGNLRFSSGFLVAAGAAQRGTLNSLTPTQSPTTTYRRALVSSGYENQYQPVPRSIWEQLTPVATAGTTLKTLAAVTIPADALARVGDGVTLRFRGDLAAHATATRDLTADLEGTATLTVTGLVTPDAADFQADVTIRRLDLSTARVTTTPVVTGFRASALPGVDVADLDFTADLIFTFKSQAGGAGAADGDIRLTTGEAQAVPAGDSANVTVYHDLAAYWVGDSLTDLAGALTLTNPGGLTTLGAGGFGLSVNGAYLKMTPPAALRVNLDQSWEYQFDANPDFVDSAVRALVGQWSGAVAASSHLLSLEAAGNPTVRAFDGTTFRRLQSATALTAGVATRVRAGYDARTQLLYVQVGTGAVETLAAGRGAQAGTSLFEIGSFLDGASGDFDGTVGRPTFWRKSLTASEAAYVLNAGTPRDLLPLTFAGGSAAVTFTPLT